MAMHVPTGGIARLCRAFVAASAATRSNIVSIRFIPPRSDGGSTAPPPVLVVFDDGVVERVDGSTCDAGSEHDPSPSSPPPGDLSSTDVPPWDMSSGQLSGGGADRGGMEEHRSILQALGGKLRTTPTDSSDRLLGLGLAWLYADVHALFGVHEWLVDRKAEMFGAVGAEEVMDFKRNFLRADMVNYDVDAIHQVDAKNRAIVADFECLIPGKEGRGTDVAVFSDEWKVVRVQAIRH